MPLTDEQIERIAKHAFEDPTKVYRCNSEKHGSPMNVETWEDMAAWIKTTAQNPTTKYVARAEGGYLIHNPAMNFIIQADGQGSGTAFREKNFARVIGQENKLRAKNGLEPCVPLSGPVPLSKEAVKAAGVEKSGPEAGSAKEALQGIEAGKPISRDALQDRIAAVALPDEDWHEPWSAEELAALEGTAETSAALSQSQQVEGVWGAEEREPWSAGELADLFSTAAEPGRDPGHDRDGGDMSR